MDIVKHIIKEEIIRKQMYDNHECTALELEGRSFNEKILKLADRIEELEGWNQGLNTVNEKLLDRAKRAEAQLDKVRPYIRHKPDCNKMAIEREYEAHCDCGLTELQAALNGESDE